MRKLLWFTIGFATACALFAYLLPAELLRGCCLALLVFSGILVLMGRKFHLLRRTGLLALGCAVGILWCGGFDCHYLSVPASLDREIRTVTIRTMDFSQETDYGTVTEGICTLEGKDYRVRVWLDTKELLGPGYRITAPFRFSMTAPREDPVSYYSGNGCFLLAFQEDEAVILRDSRKLWNDRIAGLRQWLREAIHTSFPGDTEPFARALLLGDTSLLDYETDTDFKISGIRHVIAVSGLHVSILIALLGAVTFRKKYWMVPVGLAVLVLFTALAGFTPSIVRSCIMSGLLLLALLFNREYDGPTALSFAVLVMLMGNPLVIASVSFQLSVGSVTGIYLFDPRIRPWISSLFPDPGGKKWKQRLIRWFSASVSVTLSAMTLTTPLCAWYFGLVSLVGVVTNLLALWIISGIFCGIMGVCVLYGVWVPAAAVLGNVIAWPIRYVLGIAHGMADVPMAAVYMDSVYHVLWLIFVYILLTVFLLSRKRSPVQLFCCAVLGLCFAQLASWSEAGDTRLTVLDVGQGQCILLQSEGRTYMVDCGGDSDSRTADIAANYLLSRGISRLDGLILTHLDRDHAGAAENLMTRIETDLLILPPVHSSLSAQKTVYAAQDLHLHAGDTGITVYAPTFPGSGNEKSLCVLFDTEKCDILITGDRDAFGERMLLRAAEIPPVDILIAGHHGSKHSTSEELLAAVSPEIVCISAGEDNSYGHPAPELLQRLAAFGCTVYRTDLHGTIIIRR